MGDFAEEVRQEIRMWALQRGPGAHRRTCPECSSNRSKFGSKLECFSITVDNDHAAYRCWHCEGQGAVRLETSQHEDLKKPAKILRKNFTKALKQMGTGLDALSKAWLKGRAISEKTAGVFGLTFASAFFPDLQRETHGLAMPYYEKDKVLGHKVRSTEEKAHICTTPLGSLFGIQNVDLTESGDMLICEGELDALSFYEAGILNATSVPNGASSFLRSEGTDDRATYAFLWSAKTIIDKAKRILIATDMDEPGQKLADELARRVGKHRCWRVSFPDGCKDANDVLLKGWSLLDCVMAAEPWPVEGLYEADHFYAQAAQLYEKGFGERVGTGLSPVDDIYSVGKGLLTVVTGIPGNGKTTFVDQLMVNLARKDGYISGICSFERPPHVHIAMLSEMLMQKHFFDTETPGEKMTRAEFDGTMNFITKHFKFLYQDDGKKATLESIIERIKTAVFRWGINCAVIDPYNYIGRPKSANSETEWIDDLLTQLRLLAAVHDLHIWFIAHPTKLTMNEEGGYSPPRGYSISGSAAWYSKADFGLTVHRSDKGGAVRIINWKTRFDWLGKEGEAALLYDNTQNIYITDALSGMHPYGDDKWQ